MSERAFTDIVVEEDLPHSPAQVWQALTTGSLIARWMGMEPVGFAAIPGARFTFRTTPAGAWNGQIDCEVIAVEPLMHLAYSWKAGDAANLAYGSLLDTTVTFTLTPSADGTHLRVVHSGFQLPRNAVAYENMSVGWAKCAVNLRAIANDA